MLWFWSYLNRCRACGACNPPTNLELWRVHTLLDDPGVIGKRKGKGSKDVDDNAEGGGVSSGVMAGLQAVDKLWQRDRAAWPLEDIPL